VLEEKGRSFLVEQSSESQLIRRQISISAMKINVFILKLMCLLHGLNLWFTKENQNFLWSRHVLSEINVYVYYLVNFFLKFKKNYNQMYNSKNDDWKNMFSLIPLNYYHQKVYKVVTFNLFFSYDELLSLSSCFLNRQEKNIFFFVVCSRLKDFNMNVSSEIRSTYFRGEIENICYLCVIHQKIYFF